MTIEERKNLQIGDLVSYVDYTDRINKRLRVGLVQTLPDYPNKLGHQVQFFDGTKETIYDHNVWYWKKYL